MLKIIARQCPKVAQSMSRNSCCRKLSTSNVLTQDTKKVEDGSSQSTLNDLETAAEKRTLASLDEFRVSMKPFLKELFSGNFEKIILSYPDVLDNDRYFNSEEKVRCLKEAMDSRVELVKSIDRDQRVSKDLILCLRSMGFFAHRGKYVHDGEAYSVTESLRFLEEVANININLSNLIVNSAWYGAEVIRKYGTEEMQRRYLPDIHQGTCICTVCVADDMAGVDINSSSTTAVIMGDEVLLDGTKLWVTNASNADLLIVWAKMLDKNSTGQSSTRSAAILVDPKHTKGVTVESASYKTRGLKGSNISTVKFEKVKVPISNVIVQPGKGFHALTDSFKDEAKLAGSVQVLAGLRKVLNLAIKHAGERRAFGDYLSSYESVQNKLGRASILLFALESTIYMTAGLADYQAEPDTCLEATATRLMASQTARYIGDVCKRILGSSTFLSDNEAVAILDDIEGLQWWESLEDMNNLYLGLGGLSYSAENRQEKVTNLRNPYDDLFSTFRHVRKLKSGVNSWTKEPKLRWKLHEDVHPSLVVAAKKVEVMCLYLDYVTDGLFVQHGANIQLAEIDVERLAEMATLIYAMISTLARANRSYCDGHSHADLEVKLCNTYVLLMEGPFMQLCGDAMLPDLQKVDPFVRDISQYMSSQGLYANVHPVTKNMF